jgi:hypothetical protein
MSINAEVPMVVAGLAAMGGAAAVGWAIDALLRPAGAHRALPRGERVPAEVAEEIGVAAEAEYAGFHDGPLTAGVDVTASFVAVDRLRWCAECAATRAAWIHADGSATCGAGHHTPAGGQ